MHKKTISINGFSKNWIMAVITAVVAVFIVSGLIYGWENVSFGLFQKQEETKNGTIEGSLSYPSEFIPPLTICAENITTGKQYCTDKNIEDEKYTYGKGYKLEVPSGNYYVFATGGLSGLKDVKAYYRKAPGEEPAVVDVLAGKVSIGIDPKF